MLAIPSHSRRCQPLAENEHGAHERDHRNREHVERRRACGQETQDRDPQQERQSGRNGADVEQQQRIRGAPLRRRRAEQERQRRDREHAREHLPRDEVERIERTAALEVFRRDRSRRPPESGQHRPQLGREIAAPVPGLDDERESRQREGDGDPLTALDALVQHRPCNDQRPERHREHEHRRAADAAARQRQRSRAEVHRRLEESGHDHGHPRGRPERMALPEQDREQHDHRDPRAVHVEDHRIARAQART